VGVSEARIQRYQDEKDLEFIQKVGTTTFAETAHLSYPMFVLCSKGDFFPIRESALGTSKSVGSGKSKRRR